MYVGGLCMMFAMYGCLLCMLPSSCPCAHRLISLCLCELVLLFAASPISNLPKFSTLRHGIFVQNGPSPFCSPISFLKQGPTYGAIPEKHGLLRWWWWCCCCCVTSVVSDSVRPHRRQPTRLPRPWESLGKNAGVGCHFLLHCMKVLVVKNPQANAGDLRSVASIPGSGRSPGGGHGKSF